MNPQVAEQVRALQRMSRLYPQRKTENAAKINALLSNENVKNSQMAKTGKVESATGGLIGALAKYSPINVLGSGMAYAGRALGNNTLTQTGEGLTEPIRQSQRDFQSQAGSQLAYQAGNVAGSIASSVGNPAGKAGLVINMLRYGLPAAGDTSQAIQESGGSRVAQTIGGGLSGAAQGALGAVLNKATVGRLPRTSPMLTSLAGRALLSGVGGAAENTGEQTIENLIAQRTYDKQRPWYLGLPQAAASGAAVGAATRLSPDAYRAARTYNERLGQGGYLTVGDSGEMQIDHRTKVSPESVKNNVRNLTTGLEALQYPTFEGFYNDYKSFFDDMGFNTDQAREVYSAGQGAKVIPSGQTGTRASASAQSDFELAYNSGNKAKALEAAQQIADPTAKRAALQALGQDVSTLPVAEGVTNPRVKAMLEAAMRRKANK